MVGGHTPVSMPPIVFGASCHLCFVQALLSMTRGPNLPPSSNVWRRASAQFTPRKATSPLNACHVTMTRLWTRLSTRTRCTTVSIHCWRKDGHACTGKPARSVETAHWLDCRLALVLAHTKLTGALQLFISIPKGRRCVGPSVWAPNAASLVRRSRAQSRTCSRTSACTKITRV